MLDISIHAPRAGRDAIVMFPPALKTYFNPRAPCGARPTSSVGRQTVILFQSTRPVRGATLEGVKGGHSFIISIHAPRAGRDAKAVHAAATAMISIHAPRAGRDVEIGGVRFVIAYFNPRAPCGARLPILNVRRVYWSFQSTRPVRGATELHWKLCAVGRYFNPRAPCGARR